MEVEEIIKNDVTRRIVAVGECGLDFTDSDNIDKDLQNIILMKQIEIAQKYDLPMYFYSKNARRAFAKLINENKGRIKGGVVTFFEGDAQ